MSKKFEVSYEDMLVALAASSYGELRDTVEMFDRYCGERGYHRTWRGIGAIDDIDWASPCEAHDIWAQCVILQHMPEGWSYAIESAARCDVGRGRATARIYDSQYGPPKFWGECDIPGVHLPSMALGIALIIALAMRDNAEPNIIVVSGFGEATPTVVPIGGER